MTDFPVILFREALTQINTIYSKLSENIFIEFKKHNMIWIEGSITQLLRVLLTKQNIKIKFNAIYSLKFFLQLAQYQILTMLQVYIFPVVKQIAFFSHENSKKDQQYFQSQGYSSNTPSIKQQSVQHIQNAKYFIYLGSKIKPNRTFQTHQMSQFSLFKKSADKLYLEKYEQNYVKLNSKQKINQLRTQFLKNLSQFDNDSQQYISFFMKKVQFNIIYGSKNKLNLDFKKIMKYGDVFLTSQAIGHCCQALQNPNFQFKKNALLMINQFFLWGDIQAIMMVNYAEYIQQIFQRISSVDGHLGLIAGYDIYPQIKNEKEPKQKFYIEFLKCLQIWALCSPTSNFDIFQNISSQQEQNSLVYLLYTQLKQEKKFKFPQIPYLERYKNQFIQNLKLNQERNSLIIKQLQQNGDDQMYSSSKKSYTMSNKLQKYKAKVSQIKSQRQSAEITLKEINKNIKQNQNLLNNFLQKIQNNNINQAQKVMKKLGIFSSQFDKKFDYLQQNVSDNQLQNVYINGFNLVEQINSINDHFIDYKNGQINLMQFQQLIKQEMKIKRQSKINRQTFTERKKQRSIVHLNHSYGNNSQNIFKNIINLNGQSNVSINKSTLIKQKIQRISSGIKNKINSKKNSQIYQKKSQLSQLSDINKINNIKKSDIKSMVSDDNPNEQDYQFQMNDYNFRDVNNVKFQEKSQSKIQQKQTSKFIESSKLSKPSKQKIMFIVPSKIKQKINKKSQINHLQIPQLNTFTNKDQQISIRNSIFSPKEQSLNKLQIKIPFQQKYSKIKQDSQKNISLFKQTNQLRKAIQTSFAKNISQNQNKYLKQKKQSIIQKKQNSSLIQNNQNQSIYSKRNKQINDKEQINRSSSVRSVRSKISQVLRKSIQRSQLSKNNNKIIFNDSSFQNSLKYQNSIKIKQQIQQTQNPQFKSIFRNKNQQKILNNSRLINLRQNYSINTQNLSINKSNSSKRNSQKSKLKTEKANKQRSSNQNLSNQKSIYTNTNHKFNIELGKSRYAMEKFRQSSSSNDSKIFIPKQQRTSRLNQSYKGQDQQENKYTNSIYRNRQAYQKQQNQRPRFILSQKSPRFRNQSNSRSNSNRKYIMNLSSRQLTSPLSMRRNHSQSNSSQQYIYKIDGCIINKNKYSKYLNQIQQPKISKKQKKQLLQNKSLIFKNQNLQIGIMSFKQNNKLRLIYFITSFQTIYFFNIKILDQDNTKLNITMIQNSINNLQKNRQYKLGLICEIVRIPYELPLIQFSYQLKKQKINFFFCVNTCNTSTPLTNFMYLLPVFFPKFIDIQSITQNQNKLFQTKNIYRTQQFPINQKIIKKSQDISNYFPNLIFVYQNDTMKSYAGKGKFYGYQFICKFNFKLNNFMFIQGILIQQNQHSTTKNSHRKILQFFMITLEKFFIKEFTTN